MPIDKLIPHIITEVIKKWYRVNGCGIIKGMNKPKVILIHGNGGGTGQDNWFPYVKKQLEEKGFTG